MIRPRAHPQYGIRRRGSDHVPSASRVHSADISGDAGTLMCNHLMYGVLHACSGRDIVAGWVHLPALPVRLGVLILGSSRWRGRVDGVELHAVDAMCWSHTGDGGKR